MAKKEVTKVLKHSFERVLPYILVIGGIIGTLAAFIITDEKIKLLQNPNYHPACSINPVISCGSVMSSQQSHLFGFPNSFIGMMAFPVLITLGVLLLSGVRLKRWHWLGLNAGALLGAAFVHWLFYQSVYSIHALCPYCMLVWIVTITTFWYTTLYNLQHGYLLKGKLLKVQAFLNKHHADILVFWLLIIAFFILKHFWYYYGHYL